MIIISTLSVVLLYPLFVFVLRAQSEPMLPLFVPGINETSTIGFGLLSGLHSVWATQGAVGMMFSDMFYKVMLLHIWPMVHVFGSMFQEMDEAILVKPPLAGTLEVRLWMRNIIMVHREICSQVCLF